MGLLDRWRGRTPGGGASRAGTRPAGRRARRRERQAGPETAREGVGEGVNEAQLREVLHADPNDAAAFGTLAELVRARAATAREEDDSGTPEPGEVRRAADNAEWALAEELAQSPQAWRPLLVLGRLSLGDDRDAALRRLAIAAERDASGTGLAEALRVLRGAGMNDEALSLGVGHWRPREHDPEAGQHLVSAAVDAGRLAEARRHLKALGLHPDSARVERLRTELEDRIARAADDRGAGARPE